MIFIVCALALISGAAANFEDGDVRLVGSDKPNEGEVEVFFDGEFGTICNDGWTMANAHVICRQLGYPSARVARIEGFKFEGNWILEILLDDVVCTGNERKISDCSSRAVGLSNCFHDQDVTVVCNTEILSTSADLVSDTLPWTGWYQLTWSDTSGTQQAGICYNDYFDLINADVVCREFGYVGANSVYPVQLDTLPVGVLTVYEYFSCNGSEATLAECEPGPFVKPDCETKAVTGVSCFVDVVDPQFSLEGTSAAGGIITASWDHQGTTVVAGICSTDFDLVDGRVLCKQLGFYDVATVTTTTMTTATTRTTPPLYLYMDLVCTGTESDITQCAYSELYNTDCTTEQFAQVVCIENTFIDGDVRLVGSAQSHTGMVEVYFQGRWGTVCDDRWDVYDSQVVCTQLGFPSANPTAQTDRSYTGNHNLDILLDDVQCTGTEERISDCRSSAVGSHNCQHYEDVAITCNTEIQSPIVEIISAETDTDSVSWSGSASIRWDNTVIGQVGTVCFTDFDVVDALVMCRELGYVDVQTIYEIPMVVQMMTVLEGVDCVGTETGLFECPYTSVVNTNCTSNSFPGLVCLPEMTIPSVVLTDGATPLTGVVEVSSSIEGTEMKAGICSADFGEEEAMVVCRQMGFSGVREITDVPAPRRFSSLMFFEGLVCLGTETDINDCTYTTIANKICSVSTVAAVTCGTGVAAVGDVRLVGGPAPSEGRLEVFYNDAWGTVCDDEFDMLEAQVVCRQLGYSSAMDYKMGSMFGSSPYGRAVITQDIWLDNLRCTGTEWTIADCPNAQFGVNNCFHTEDVSVVCNSIEACDGYREGQSWQPQACETCTCVNGQKECALPDCVPIVGCPEPLTSEGVCCPICPVIVDTKCEGYLEGEAWEPQACETCTCVNGEKVCTSPSCTVPLDCPYPLISEGACCPTCPVESFNCEGYFEGETWEPERCVTCTCENGETVCVSPDCPPLNCPEPLLTRGACCPTCPDVDSDFVLNPETVRLVDGDTPAGGRVEVFYDGQWGAVCDDSWDILDAQVVCHMLGYPSASNALTHSYFGTAQMDYWITRVECLGDETSLDRCLFRTSVTDTCEQAVSQAGVLCNTETMEATFRLVSGPAPNAGMLRVTFNGDNGPVCDDSFDMNAADVVCRQLGYPRASRLLPNEPYTPPQGAFMLDDVVCSGTESSIVNCAHAPWLQHNCVRGEAVGIECVPEEVCDGHAEGETWEAQPCEGCICESGTTVCSTPMCMFPDCDDPIQGEGVCCPTCPETDATTDKPVTVRLMDGDTPAEGRVEVLRNGQWGAVCDVSWDIYDAQVVCHMIGYPSASKGVTGSLFQSRAMSYNMFNVECNGYETDIDSCPHRTTTFIPCVPGLQHAGVICNTDDRKFTLRLVNGPTPHEGMLRVTYGHNNGPVCDDSFTLAAASVACKEMGFVRAAEVLLEEPYTPPRGDYVMGEVICTGSEVSLANCAHDPWMSNDCTLGKAVGIRCIPEDNGVIDVRMVDGYTITEGVIEIYFDETWTTLCTALTINEAQVLCRELGFVSAQSDPAMSFSPAEGAGIKVDFSCVGDERTISECNRTAVTTVTGCDNVPLTEIFCNTGPEEVSIRLVDGGIDTVGRLEVLYDGQYGTVCDDFFTIENAEVACRQLGFGGARMVAREGHFGEAEGPIWMDDVKCFGTEKNLAECSHPGWGIQDCAHEEDIGIVCYRDYTTIEVELTGTTVNKGVVTVTVEGISGHICGDGFDKADADVICRTMGYTTATDSQTKPRGTTSTIVSNVACTGKETSLLDCDHSRWFAETCRTNTVASVTCELPVEGAIRLSDGPTTLQGRVEIYHAGAWGTVCDDQFDYLDARVVCEELGHGEPLDIKTWTFGAMAPDTPIWVDELQCTKQDTRVADCLRSPYGENDCAVSENAGVICGEKPPVTVALVNGQDEHEGGIQIMTAAGDTFGICSRDLTFADGTVLCRQMGFRGVAQILRHNYFALDTGRSVWVDFGCVGTESSIMACQRFHLSPDRKCIQRNTMSLMCIQDDGPLPVRLTGGLSDADGRVEVLYSGEYGTICDVGFTTTSANVICQSLGYLAAESYRTVSPWAEVDNSIPVWMDNVRCTGTEGAIELCPNNGFEMTRCTHAQDVVVSCTNEVHVTPSTEEGTLRLVNTTTYNNGLYISGRLEVFYDTAWGTICDDSFELTDANTACVQLGYDKAVTVFSTATVGEGTGPIWLDDVKCLADATTIDQCDYSFDTTDCTHSEDVGIACIMGDFDYPVRLAGGQWTTGEGRVEIQVDGVWGTICSEGWDMTDADTVCRAMGYPSAQSAVINAQFGAGLGPVWVSNVDCTDGDATLATCTHDGFGVHDCDHSLDAGVTCKTVKKANATLVDPISEAQGTLQLQIAGMSRSVCFDGFDHNEATVACRELGFTSFTSYDSVYSPTEGLSTRLRCTGIETNLGDCRTDFTQCKDDLVTTISCAQSQDGDVRLIGHMSTEGRVEFFYNGRWGTVCDDKWGLPDANTVCRQLGFSKATRAMGYAAFGPGTGPIWLDDVACTGQEESLGTCMRSNLGINDCMHAEDAGAVCEMEVRLVGGVVPNEGRVEMKYEGEWGTICYNGFDQAAADVVCRQLSYTSATQIRTFQPGNGRILLDDVTCNGQETQLAMCQHSGFGGTDGCTHSMDIGVKCT